MWSGNVTTYFPGSVPLLVTTVTIQLTTVIAAGCRSEMFSAMTAKFSFLLFLIVQGERLMVRYS